MVSFKSFISYIPLVIMIVLILFFWNSGTGQLVRSLLGNASGIIEATGDVTETTAEYLSCCLPGQSGISDDTTGIGSSACENQCSQEVMNEWEKYNKGEEPSDDCEDCGDIMSDGPGGQNFCKNCTPVCHKEMDSCAVYYSKSLLFLGLSSLALGIMATLRKGITRGVSDKINRRYKSELRQAAISNGIDLDKSMYDDLKHQRINSDARMKKRLKGEVAEIFKEVRSDAIEADNARRDRHYDTLNDPDSKASKSLDELVKKRTRRFPPNKITSKDLNKHPELKGMLTEMGVTEGDLNNKYLTTEVINDNKKLRNLELNEQTDRAYMKADPNHNLDHARQNNLVHSNIERNRLTRRLQARTRPLLRNNHPRRFEGDLTSNTTRTNNRLTAIRRRLGGSR